MRNGPPPACRVCGGETRHEFDAVVLRKYPSEGVYCDACGFLGLEDASWLDKAYDDAIAFSDTGLVRRNIELRDAMVPLLFHIFGSDGRFVDVGAGTGLLVRMMRDAGLDFYWSDAYCRNVHALGFEAKWDGARYSAITAIEVMEHVLHPVRFLSDVLTSSRASFLLFTTQVFEGEVPSSEDWWYYALDEGQHVSFYQARTLNHIARVLGLEYCAVGPLQVFFDGQVAERLKSYRRRRWARAQAARRAKRHLQPKTESDRELLLAQYSGRRTGDG